MENTRVKVELEIKPEIALLLGMVLHGGTYGYNVVSKLLTPKSLKDLHDIGQSIIDQVESERDMATYEKELLTIRKNWLFSKSSEVLNRKNKVSGSYCT